ncbi:PREDICTED: jerky protein homolog-like [Dufourea novaeangliae]|uniref:jerky protein homolog-like n=1 Tax=Dufourea novaeangliae TaxID=178035 RepID=UPI000767A23E|nr:PREDICTED: jerky protein homolog-like [Dufourea novaeangliae]
MVDLVRRNAASMSEFAEKNEEQKKRRRFTKRMYEELDRRMLTWIAERRAHGDTLSDATILEKAAEIKKNTASYSDYKLTKYWLMKFKKRNDVNTKQKVHIKQEVHRKRSSVDRNEAKIFIENFKKLIEGEKIDVENIYNMDESRLLWKALPTQMLADIKEKHISDYKMQKRSKKKSIRCYTNHKGRIRMILCANVSGTNKITPLVINKSKKPKPKTNAPIILKSQANGCMNQSLFLDWFQNQFKPNVRAFQAHKQIFGKVILLLNNCKEYEVPTDMKEDFEIMYVPLNTSLLLRPMYHKVTKKTKKGYRHKMRQRILRYDGGFNEFCKQYNIKDCIQMLAESWGEITAENIKSAWETIITGPVSDFQRNKGDKEQEETVDRKNHDKNNMNELTYLVQRLTHHSATAPSHIQSFVDGIKQYFLLERKE